ncbi:hypothetical protein VNI00_005317 [Paramarasmius palmivorus]|uniref:Uncharacterized protein n=1 Tax=Paramarasmius palmivorus TaxID=297713 RepID=A0AAW0DFP8_9AGAR
MAVAPKVQVVFPAPPPTTNILSYQQRNQLMRTTKKLGRVLGYTPHLVDNRSSGTLSSVSEDQWSDDEEEWYRPVSRGSTRSNSTSASGSAYSTTSGVSSRHSRSSSISYSNRSTASSRSMNSEDSWSSHDRKPPLLRLAVPSPFRPRSQAQASPTSSVTDSSEEEDTRFTLRPTTDRNPRDSLVSPNFHIPSATTLRLQKMDRIRRKLGDGVPVELVFPENDTDDDIYDTPSPRQSRTTVIHISAPTPVKHDHVTSTSIPPLPSTPPPQRPAKSRGTGISGARDSIVSSSAHRGHRVKRKPVPQLEPTRPAPPPPVDVQKRKDRLSLILENPEDISPSKLRQTTSPTSEWFSEDDGIEQWRSYLKMTQQ